MTNEIHWLPKLKSTQKSFMPLSTGLWTYKKEYFCSLQYYYCCNKLLVMCFFSINNNKKCTKHAYKTLKITHSMSLHCAEVIEPKAVYITIYLWCTKRSWITGKWHHTKQNTKEIHVLEFSRYCNVCSTKVSWKNTLSVNASSTYTKVQQYWEHWF